MLQPNDLPLLCLRIDLSDEAAAKLVEFLHEITEALERHYAAQLLRYYNASDFSERDPGPHARIHRSAILITPPRAY